MDHEPIPQALHWEGSTIQERIRSAEDELEGNGPERPTKIRTLLGTGVRSIPAEV